MPPVVVGNHRDALRHRLHERHRDALVEVIAQVDTRQDHDIHSPLLIAAQNLFVEPVAEKLHRVVQRQLGGQLAQRFLQFAVADELQGAGHAAILQDGHGPQQILMTLDREEVGRTEEHRPLAGGGRGGRTRGDRHSHVDDGNLAGWMPNSQGLRHLHAACGNVAHETRPRHLRRQQVVGCDVAPMRRKAPGDSRHLAGRHCHRGRRGRPMRVDVLCFQTACHPADPQSLGKHQEIARQHGDMPGIENPPRRSPDTKRMAERFGDGCPQDLPAQQGRRQRVFLQPLDFAVDDRSGRGSRNQHQFMPLAEPFRYFGDKERLVRPEGRVRGNIDDFQRLSRRSASAKATFSH